jgi:hypothetical protein
MGKIKKFFVDKVELLSLLFFILSIFLIDVNLNMIGAYGLKTEVNFFNETKFASSSLVWLGFLLAFLFFFIIAIRSMYKRQKKLTKFDIFFGTIGVLGLMITLSGGLLLFYQDALLLIPFFSYTLTRATYYHIGLVLNFISVLYFALTK